MRQQDPADAAVAQLVTSHWRAQNRAAVVSPESMLQQQDRRRALHVQAAHFQQLLAVQPQTSASVVLPVSIKVTRDKPAAPRARRELSCRAQVSRVVSIVLLETIQWRSAPRCRPPVRSVGLERIQVWLGR